MGKHKIRGLPEIGVGCDYGGHEIFSGSYRSFVKNKCSKITVWTQAGDDCEGNSNGNPAADITITEKEIVLESSDGLIKKWKTPEYKADLKEIQEEVDEELEKYYAQFIRQPAFVRKDE